MKTLKNMKDLGHEFFGLVGAIVVDALSPFEAVGRFLKNVGLDLLAIFAVIALGVLDDSDRKKREQELIEEHAQEVL